MKLKNMFYAILSILVSASTLTSCEKDPVIEKDVKVTSGVYVLNSGKFQLNNASISYYDVNTKAVSPDIFNLIFLNCIFFLMIYQKILLNL